MTVKVILRSVWSNERNQFWKKRKSSDLPDDATALPASRTSASTVSDARRVSRRLLLHRWSKHHRNAESSHGCAMVTLTPTYSSQVLMKFVRRLIPAPFRRSPVSHFVYTMKNSLKKTLTRNTKDKCMIWSLILFSKSGKWKFLRNKIN